MNCAKCNTKLDPSDVKVVEDASDAEQMDITLRCGCGQLYYTFVPMSDLVAGD